MQQHSVKRLQSLNFAELSADTSPNGKRVYTTPDGKQYPSVTTILSALKGDDFLKDWKDRVGHEKAANITRLAADRGTKVHAIYEDYVGGILKDPSEYEFLQWEYFKHSKKFLDIHLTGVYDIEVALYSDRLKTAGRCDLICEWDNEPAILDYKTSGKEKKKEWIEDYFIQVCLYAMMVFELTGLKINKLVVFIVNEENPKVPQIFVESTSDWIPKAVKKIKEYYEKNGN